MGKRRAGRELTLQVLYQLDIINEPIHKILAEDFSLPYLLYKWKSDPLMTDCYLLLYLPAQNLEIYKIRMIDDNCLNRAKTFIPLMRVGSDQMNDLFGNSAFIC